MHDWQSTGGGLWMRKAEFGASLSARQDAPGARWKVRMGADVLAEGAAIGLEEARTAADLWLRDALAQTEVSWSTPWQQCSTTTWRALDIDGWSVDVRTERAVWHWSTRPPGGPILAQGDADSHDAARERAEANLKCVFLSTRSRRR